MAIQNNGFFSPGLAGAGDSFMEVLTSAIPQVVGTMAPDVPKPMDLYNEAAPRVVRLLRQYDAASPGIDWITKNWWLAVVSGFALGVAASYLAQAIYGRAHPSR